MSSQYGREATLLRQQSALAQFGELALRSDDLDHILSRACELVRDALHTPLSKVMELQPGGDTLLVRAGVGWPPGIVGHATASARGTNSESLAIKTGEPVVSSDREQETRFSYADFLIENGVRALVNVNIIGPDDAGSYGLLEVDHREPRVFTQDDIAFLRTYANLIAAAVARLRGVETMRATERALRSSEQDYRAATAHNPQIPWTSDPQGRVLSVDDRWLALTGLSREAALSDGWLAVPHPEELGEMVLAWQSALQSGEPYDVRVRLFTVAHGYQWHRVQAYAQRDGAGVITKWFGTVENIQERQVMEDTLREWNSELEKRVSERTRALELEQRERQATEEQLRQSQKMEAVGQLTGGLAHDFNNLLTGITGSLELAQTRLLRGHHAHLDRYLTSALTSAHRAAALTHRLLAFSRRQTLEPRPTEADALVNGMIELIQRTVGPGVSVTTSVGTTATPILCDPHQLENALLNLAINARDAMPEGGRLTISTDVVELDTALARRQDTSAGKFVRLSVTDTGVGMSPDIIERAFDPFFTTKPLGEGTGLGLSMIYGFAKQSGGQTRIHSKVGMGTTVSIYLPIRETPSLADSVTLTPDLPGIARGERVMIVDDEAVIRMIGAEVLQERGYIVTEAGEGATALRQIEKMTRLDVLVTDVGLPGIMNGRQLADAARARHPSLKVLFITGFADVAVVGERGLEEGMQIMSKPFAVEALAVRVHDLLNSPGTLPGAPETNVPKTDIGATS